MTDTIDETESRLLGGFWQVVAAHGWQGVTLRRLAAAAGLPAATIRVRCPGGPRDLLALHGRAMDAAVAAGTVPGQGGTPRDRLFDVLMRRIDAMQPHRAGVVRLLEELRGDLAQLRDAIDQFWRLTLAAGSDVRTADAKSSTG